MSDIAAGDEIREDGVEDIKSAHRKKDWSEDQRYCNLDSSPVSQSK
jgi:hypothetical protein